MESKHLAILLAGSRMRDVNVWGRYLGQMGATRQVSSGIKDYFRTLYGDDRIESKLIGIGLADVYRQAVGKLIMDIGEPLFKRLLKREFKYAGKNVDLLEDYLTTRVLNLEQEGRGGPRTGLYLP